MEIVVGKTAGFCFGVLNAVNKAKEATKNNNKIYCLGEIVHNKQVTEELHNSGIEFIDDIKKAKGKMIIRSHGVEKRIYQEATRNNIELIDLTCPKVLKIHEIASEYEKDGYYIFLLGEKMHPETVGTVSFCGSYYTVIEKYEELKNAIINFKDSKLKKLLLLAQTTYSLEQFEKIKFDLEKIMGVDLTVINTICQATRLRQKETEEIAKQVDIMIVVGGKNSSNTQKLYHISEKLCEKTIYVETKDNIDLNDIKKYEKIGVMAGASTPQKSIKDVVEYITQI